MGLTPEFTKADIRKYVKDRLRNYKKAIESRLIRTGEEFVTLARNLNTYKDRTGNLRSSIGYVVLYNGKVISKSFEVKNGGDDGVEKAKSFIEKIAAEFNSGYALIGVAGMDYAAAVESQGKDVLTGTSQLAEEILKKALKRIDEKING